jgi:hypothetical protein
MRWRLRTLNVVAGLSLIPLTPFAVLCFWNWFGVPLGVSRIDFVEACGLSLSVLLVAGIAWGGAGAGTNNSAILQSDFIFIAKTVALVFVLVVGLALHSFGHAVIDTLIHPRQR